MAKQILSTGNTGAELVSKFNNNFGDLYGGVYNITEYNCVGDAATDNTTAFTTLLSAIGAAQATIKIPKGRFLIGTCTIPANIELVFENGGRIIWKSGATIVIHGYINAGHKWIFENESEVAENLPNLGIHRQEWVSPIWFGGKMSGDNADATTNYNAFRSVWNCSERNGNTVMGSSIKFPAGIFIMNGFQNNIDGFKLSAKYADIVGAGKTKTTIMLASGQNKSLWSTFDNFDFNFRDIGFNGNASGNTEMTAPLISIDYYRVYFENVFITNCTTDGLYFNAGQTNALNFHNLTITLCGGTGLIIEDALCFSLSGMVDIESCNGCIDIKQRGLTFYDSRYNMRGVVNISLYAESCTTGIRLFGVGGVYLKLNAYARSTQNLVHLIYDTTDYGSGARNMPCMNNVIDISQSQDRKVDPNYNRVYIDDKCAYNDITSFWRCKIIDNDGRNKIGFRDRKGYFQKQISDDFSGDNYVTYTHPYYAEYKYGEGINYPKNNIIPDTLAYVAALNDCVSVAGGLFQRRIEGGVIPSARTIYAHLLIKGDAGTTAELGCWSGYGDDYNYDFIRKEWSLESIGNLNIINGILEMNGEWQYFSVPISVTEEIAGVGLWISYTQSDASIQCQFFNISDNPNQGMVHIKNSVIIGYNFDSMLDSSALPDASLVKKMTKNFCPDLGMEVISDGTNWKKPDGTTLGA